MSLMKLKSFKYFFGFLIVLTSTQLKSEDKIDIWKNKNIHPLDWIKSMSIALPEN